MIFNPHNPHKWLHSMFPSFSCLVAICHLLHTKYLGHIIDHTLHDDSDINRDTQLMWNCDCSEHSVCVFYDTSLWKYYKVGTMNKLVAAYIKCVKIFFGYAKFSSVTGMLLDLWLPWISTLLHNAGFRFTTRLNCSVNSLVRNVMCI